MERKSKYTKDVLEPVVKRNFSLKGVLKDLGICQTGGSSNYIRNLIDSFGIDRKHFKSKQKFSENNGMFKNGKTLKEIMVENSTYSRTHLKTKILKERLIENKCQICGQLPEWKGKPMVLILDHINGVYDDHRLENLRMVCPNCNSQLDTYCRGNKRNKW